MENRKITAAACGFALTACALGLQAYAATVPQTVASQFSTANYQHYLDNVLFTHLGHNKGIGGAQHDPCRDAIAAELTALGYTVELHPFTYQAVTYFNVIATKTGTVTPAQQYFVSGHYDTVNNPGADDDASGIAAMLEIARVFAPLKSASTLKFAAWDREEQNKVGSTAYVNTHPLVDIRAVVQIDMVAHDVGLNQENVYGNATSLPLKQALMSAAASYGNGINIFDAGNATFSDHAPFAAAGYRAVAFVEHNYQTFGCYHNPCDSVDTPNYIHYAFASNLGRSVAGWLADASGAYKEGDATGDLLVNVEDLLAVIGQWGACSGTCPPHCAGDQAPAGTGDCQVNVSDLLMVISRWGS